MKLSGRLEDLEKDNFDEDENSSKKSKDKDGDWFQLYSAWKGSTIYSTLLIGIFAGFYLPCGFYPPLDDFLFDGFYQWMIYKNPVFSFPLITNSSL